MIYFTFTSTLSQPVLQQWPLIALLFYYMLEGTKTELAHYKNESVQNS
jgi:hypothetical protein